MGMHSVCIYMFRGVCVVSTASSSVFISRRVCRFEVGSSARSFALQQEEVVLCFAHHVLANLFAIQSVGPFNLRVRCGEWPRLPLEPWSLHHIRVMEYISSLLILKIWLWPLCFRLVDASSSLCPCSVSLAQAGGFEVRHDLLILFPPSGHQTFLSHFRRQHMIPAS
jgi:hypothetical protein